MTLRPSALVFMLVAALSIAAMPRAHAADIERHGVSLFGDLKYKSDFKHFDYVNPQAPKGGELRISVVGGYDSFNAFIVKGVVAGGVQNTYDTLMASSMDEAGSEYGLIAESVSYPADHSSVTFTLRPEARFHDGKRITPEDVIWTFEMLKKYHPFSNAYYATVLRAEKIGTDKVRFVFSGAGNRELPQIVGQLPVLPKHYWLGKDKTGKVRDFSQTTLEPPLGSGAYRIGAFTPGRSVTLERVKDYWAKDLPVMIGTNNFERLRFEYFGTQIAAFQAFTGGQIDWWLESSAKNWATAYDIPPVKDGRIVKELVNTRLPQGMQGFIFNLRRAKFQDVRVRQAFNWAMDFEWQNKNIFFDQYKRSNSYFANSELASRGLPLGKELALLKPFEKQLPLALFTEPYKNPVTDGSGNNRANLRKATELLREAGWSIKDGKLTNVKGEVFTVEFLLNSEQFERVVAPYKQSLERLGMKVSVRVLDSDSAQYQRREDTRDYDIIVTGFGQSLSPGNEQREFWGCEAAKRIGSRNVIGICDPVIEKLIDKVIFATSREELVAATHALDRVLLWRAYVVPQWHSPSMRMAYWRGLAHPKALPPYSSGFPDIWWHDSSKSVPRQTPKP
jgi:microcin C transport system substrate-binding protein